MNGNEKTIVPNKVEVAALPANKKRVNSPNRTAMTPEINPAKKQQRIDNPMPIKNNFLFIL